VTDVATYHLSFDDSAIAAAYQFQPGQFNMLYLPGFGEVPISLSADPNSSTTWAHTVRAVGNVTQQLARLRVGDTLGLRGPFGSCWPLSTAVGHDVVVVTGGLGLAPLRPAIYELLRHASLFRSLTLLYGSRSPDTILFEQELPEWSKRGLQVQLTVDRADPTWSGRIGVVTLLLDQLPLNDPQRTSLFTCGPEVMMRFVGKSALARGIPEQQIWLSMERNMQCAIGLCGHCQLGPTFICKDGPVYRHDQLAPFLNVEGL
jgi:NAD(P)H-flavin reductase